MVSCYSLHNDEARLQGGIFPLCLTELFQICKDTRAELLKVDRLASSLSFFTKMSSKLQTEIGRLIRWQFQDYEIQENLRPDWMTTPEGERLELDFYIPALNIAFEIQGEQHYRFVNHFHRSIDGFADQVRRDQRKRELCITHEIELIEIASVSEFDLARDVIQTAIKKQLRNNLGQFLLQRTAQEVINQIALQEKIRIAESKKRGASKQRVAQLDKKILKHQLSLEVAKETMRHISILGIKEFNGIQRIKKDGWEFAMELRRQGKQTVFEKGRYRACMRINTGLKWLGKKV
jgi:hypothetical protein